MVSECIQLYCLMVKVCRDSYCCMRGKCVLNLVVCVEADFSHMRSHMQQYKLLWNYERSINVTGFVKIDPNHTGTEIHFIAEH